MDEKTAVYVCSGCDIGDSVDLGALAEVAADEYDIETTREHACLCGGEGRELIAADIRDDGVNAIVVAACSPRVMADAFTFGGVQTERVNLREQVVWSHEPDDEDTQMLAEDYLRMGLVRAEKVSVPDPVSEDVDQTILVVGGGVSGMSAALDAARAGKSVVLVEKEDGLGGWMGKFSRQLQHAPPYREVDTNRTAEQVAAVEAEGRISVQTSTTIGQITGQPGQFDVTLNGNGAGTTELRVGAIVQATGWKPYDASKLGYLGHGASPDVVTNVQMEEMVAARAIKRPSDDQAPKRIAFIQCAGSRDEDHLPYCSAVCCRVSIKQALVARELNPDAEVYVLYKDIRTPGQYEELYRRAQEDAGIFLTKVDVTGVEPSGDSLVVHGENSLLGDAIDLEADMVVLATGMVPRAADGEAVRRLTDAKKIVEKGEEGAQLETAKETLEELKHLEGAEILNLGYRQGPDLPVLKYDFPDSHFICFPYETRRTGIYAAGNVRSPQDSMMAKEDGSGAALKAIQTVELAAKGETVHPRWGDMSHPEFALQRCTQCKRCTEECPFGTLNEDEKGTPQPNPLRCRRCGICMGACPERIISFDDYSPEIVSSMIKSVHIPDEWDEKPRLLGFLCENDAYPALDAAGLNRIQHSAYIRFVPVRCLGSVNVVWVADALARGFDGVLLVGCRSGDDYQCHYIRGSELMETRSKNVQEKLQQLALEEERVRLEQLPIDQYHRLPEIINEFAEEVDMVGLNPFKGM